MKDVFGNVKITMIAHNTDFNETNIRTETLFL